MPSLESELFAELIAALSGPVVDVSNEIARIHVASMQLETSEPGLWWDCERNRLILAHPAVTEWMKRYNFGSLADMHPGALRACAESLERRVKGLDRLAIEPAKKIMVEPPAV